MIRRWLLLPTFLSVFAGLVAFQLAGAAQTGGGVQPGRVRQADPIKAEEVPARRAPRPIPPRGTYTPPRTPWGDPDIAGPYNNSDESGIPLERPDEFAGRRLQDFTAADLEALTRQRQQQTIERAPGLSEFPGATSPMHWFEHYFAANSRAWLVADPPDGKVPPVTGEGRTRAADRAAARMDRGPADSWEDRSLYDRCITRGIPGSMMPAIYGNSYHIQQAPGYVTITYEMVHDTRVIPLDNRPHLSPAIRQYMGDARGRWEGHTLVVETTNFTDKTPYRGSSEHLRIVERFTPIGPDTLEWSITFDDPHTWSRPWTLAMHLTHDESQPPFEYACHEGNYGLRNILSAAREEERQRAIAIQHQQGR